MSRQSSKRPDFRPRPATAILLYLVAGLVAPLPAPGQTPADSVAITQAALDYIEGWYEADGERMARAVHPELVKRILERGSEDERTWLSNQGASELVTATARGGGSDTPEEERRSEVTILDIFRDAASVRVDAHAWIDYMHLARTEEGWKIVNVLWERRARGPLDRADR